MEKIISQNAFKRNKTKKRALRFIYIFLAKSRFSQMAAKHKLIHIKISTAKSKHAEMRLQASPTFRQPARRNTHTTQPGTAPSGVAGSLLSFRSFRNKMSFFPEQAGQAAGWRWQAGSHQTTQRIQRIQSISKHTAGSVSLKTDASSNCKADPPRWERRKSKQNCEVNIISWTRSVSEALPRSRVRRTRRNKMMERNLGAALTVSQPAGIKALALLTAGGGRGWTTVALEGRLHWLYGRGPMGQPCTTSFPYICSDHRLFFVF